MCTPFFNQETERLAWDRARKIIGDIQKQTQQDPVNDDVWGASL